uniref:Uncharacterized protein n=1 Tax=Capitella teleta TaxID=283909 RepID=X1YXP9_CAPTE
MQEEFSLRFADIHSYAKELKPFCAWFADPEDEPADMQLELIELQCSNQFRSKFNLSITLSFKTVQAQENQISALVEHAMKIASMYGSTYLCKQLFSRMKLTKLKAHA